MDKRKCKDCDNCVVDLDSTGQSGLHRCMWLNEDWPVVNPGDTQASDCDGFLLKLTQEAAYADVGAA